MGGLRGESSREETTDPGCRRRTEEPKEEERKVIFQRGKQEREGAGAARVENGCIGLLRRGEGRDWGSK
jgi:hypothetical protein